MSEQSISSVVGNLSAELATINTRIGTAHAGLADAYRELVKLIQDNASAFTDETGKLKAGVLDSVTRVAPNVDRSTFSSAWSAFQADPDAFAQATAVRAFAKIAKDAKGNPDKSDMSKALQALTSAVRKAHDAGVRAETVADVVRAAYKPAPKAEPKAAEPVKVEPAPEPVKAAEPVAQDGAPVVLDVIESKGAKAARKAA